MRKKSYKKEPVILSASNKPVDVLLSVEDANLEAATLSANAKFITLIERSRARQKSKGGISSTEMRRRLGVK